MQSLVAYEASIREHLARAIANHLHFLGYSTLPRGLKLTNAAAAPLLRGDPGRLTIEELDEVLLRLVGEACLREGAPKATEEAARGDYGEI